MYYREMSLHEANKIRDIDANYYIENAWRINPATEKYELVRIDWTDHELPNGIDWHINRFKETITTGGKAIGCFDEKDELLGYITINSELFGRQKEYVLLDQLFVSNYCRGTGIGKALIELGKKEALSFGAKKIYLCAGSAQDTIAFYKRIGANPAMELNIELFEEDPNDIQMELML